MTQPITLPEAPEEKLLLPPSSPTITPATDLGGVAVLKHGNLYLLTDPFGDIHPDSRGLGLYHSDTRLISCPVSTRRQRSPST